MCWVTAASGKLGEAQNCTLIVKELARHIWWKVKGLYRFNKVVIVPSDFNVE